MPGTEVEPEPIDDEPEDDDEPEGCGCTHDEDCPQRPRWWRREPRAVGEGRCECEHTCRARDDDGLPWWLPWWIKLIVLLWRGDDRRGGDDDDE